MPIVVELIEPEIIAIRLRLSSLVFVSLINGILSIGFKTAGFLTLNRTICTHNRKTHIILISRKRVSNTRPLEQNANQQ